MSERIEPALTPEQRAKLYALLRRFGRRTTGRAARRAPAPGGYMSTEHREIASKRMLVTGIRVDFVWQSNYVSPQPSDPKAVAVNAELDLAASDGSRATVAVPYDVARSLRVGDPYTVQVGP